MRRFLAMIIGLLALAVTGQAGAQTVSVMTYNIHHGADTSGADALTSQGLAIKAAAPDIVGLQEIDQYCQRSGNIDQMAVLAKLTGMKKAFAPHFDFQGGEYGLGLLSRFPLSDVRNDRVTLYAKDGTTETRALLSAVVTLDDGTTAIAATVHMGLDQRTRLKQAEEILNYLGDRGVPVVLTGDLNAEPGTEDIKLLEREFQDVGTNAPDAHTFPVGKPVKTIDYIMIDRENLEEVKDFRVLHDVEWSDHYPVWAVVRLK